jgi:putative DNA primase/helicase
MVLNMEKISTTTAGNRGSVKTNQHINFTSTEAIEQFKSAMMDSIGYVPETIIGDGVLYRFKDNNGKKNGAYKLHLDGIPAGYFKDHKTKIESNWKMDGDFKPFTHAEKKAFAIERQRQAVERQAEEIKRHNAAVEKAVSIWGRSTPAIDHPYLIRKHVQAHNLRQYKGSIVVPIYNQNKQQVNLQFINADGSKRFLAGGKKKDCFSVIGKPNPDQQLLICEGWATGASLHETTGLYVVVALDAGNLEPVAKVIRCIYPKAEIIIAGDNDESGVGQKAARAASLAVGGKYIIPATPGEDWNDSLTSGGIYHG